MGTAGYAMTASQRIAVIPAAVSGARVSDTRGVPLAAYPSSGSHVRRLLAVSVVILAALVTAPALAAARTIVVDDDGAGSYQACNESRRAKRTIGAAIRAAGPDDTIWICPGTYRETLTISGERDGLTIEGSRPHTTILLVEPVFGRGIFGPAVILIEAVDRVTIRGLAIRVQRFNRHWSERDVGMSGIEAYHAQDLVIDDNAIAAVGNGSWSGLANGIELLGSTAVVTDNLIRDPFERGIRAGVHYYVSGSNVTIRGNTVADPRAGDSTPKYAAISIDGEDALVEENTITVKADGGDPFLHGIHIANPTPEMTVRDNVIRRQSTGILAVGGYGLLISDNRVVDAGLVGIQLDRVNIATIRENDANAVGGYVGIAFEPGIGILIGSDSEGNSIIANDATGSTGLDLLEEEQRQSADPNTWSGNIADDCDPTSICLMIG